MGKLSRKKISISLLLFSLLFLSYYLLISHKIQESFERKKDSYGDLEDSLVHSDFPVFDSSIDSKIQKPHLLSSFFSSTNEKKNETIDYESQIIKLESRIVPGLGDFGEKVLLNDSQTLRESERVFKEEAFNRLVSDLISYHRIVPDTRDPACLNLTYDEKVLPSVSVIIIFTNEAWSSLIRTIWSVLDNSKDSLLKEIILVDDFSDKEHLKGKLDYYIQSHFYNNKVKLLRLSRRQGLIVARLAGAKAASGDVLLFLDAHCECGPGWLEPLLFRISQNPKAFVLPIIDVIDDKTLEYYHGNGNYFQVGGFTWSGSFTWINIQKQEMSRRNSSIAPTRSPTMAGGLFAVNRKYFWEIGSYDEDMEVWGGENLEMSFRVWQCGGTLETIPCSRVGHIFRSFHPYEFPNHKDTHGINTARTVEVWMDDYKRLFYNNRPDLLKVNIGNLSVRQEFKKKFHCKSFDWYLSHIYPEKFIPDDPKFVRAYGQVFTDSHCLDTLVNDDKDEFTLGIFPCHSSLTSSQFFSYSLNDELRHEDSCASIDSSALHSLSVDVAMKPCSGIGEDQKWTYFKNGRLFHKSSKKCLDFCASCSERNLRAVPCKMNAPTQRWTFDKNFFSNKSND